MSATTQKQALESLRERIDEAKRTAGVALRDVTVEELEPRVAAHKLGENANGWVNPYPKDDPRSLQLEYQFAYHHDESRFKAALATLSRSSMLITGTPSSSRKTTFPRMMVGSTAVVRMYSM